MNERIIKYFSEFLGESEAERFFEAIKEKKTRRSLRVNTLRISKKHLKEFLKSNGYEVKDNPYSEDGIDIEGRGETWSLKLPYHAGWTYPQDSSSMFAVELLDPQPNEKVLDLTAAPGGKTTHIAQKMRNTGLLLANDMDTKRLRALHYNLERLGVYNTLTCRKTPHSLSQMYPETFDRILLDPSCSGEGLFVTRLGLPDFWNQKALKSYSKDQFSLLCSAFRMLKVGGRLVYSSCTLNTIENDGVAEQLLARFPEARILEASEYPENLRIPEQKLQLKGIRFWPQDTKTKGFFCIAFTKTAPLNLPPCTETLRHQKRAPKKIVAAMSKKMEKLFGFKPEGDFVEKNGHLFLVSKGLMYFQAPTYFSLSFPAIDLENMSLDHAGALYWGGLAQKSLIEISDSELEAMFASHKVVRNEENDYGENSEFIAKHGEFILGFARYLKQELEIKFPQV